MTVLCSGQTTSELNVQNLKNISLLYLKSLLCKQEMCDHVLLVSMVVMKADNYVDKLLGRSYQSKPQHLSSCLNMFITFHFPRAQQYTHAHKL